MELQWDHKNTHSLPRHGLPSFLYFTRNGVRFTPRLFFACQQTNELVTSSHVQTPNHLSTYTDDSRYNATVPEILNWGEVTNKCQRISLKIPFCYGAKFITSFFIM
jgi:hypothetical protein